MCHQTLPQNPDSENKKRKRKGSDRDELRNSAFFKICAIVHQLRPHFFEVLRTPDFRNCQAAHEIRKRMKFMMHLYNQMQIEGHIPQNVEPTAPPCISCEKTLKIEQPDGPEKEKTEQLNPQSKKEQPEQKDHPQSELPEKSADKEVSLEPVRSGKNEDDTRPQGTYIVGVRGLGINYGLLGDNLPPPDQVVPLLKSRNINKIRIFDPNPDVLNALHGSGIEVVIGVRNEDLQRLANDAAFAQTWVSDNIEPHASSVTFSYVTAGNEVIPGPLDAYVLGAMHNLDSALKSADLPVPVSTVVSLQVLGQSYPPSDGAFAETVISAITPIVQFLAAEQTPLFVNVYPCFAYINNPAQVKLEYALFQETVKEVSDGSSSYSNLFDSMVDATYFALEKVEGGAGVDIVVAETGWPSAGNGDATTTENAQTYINNLIDHVACDTGTPKRRGKHLETYIFALFNEDLKPAGTEQHFGLYYPDMTEVYHVNFPS